MHNNKREILATMGVFAFFILGLAIIILPAMFYALVQQEQKRLFNYQMTIEQQTIEKAEKICDSRIVEYMKWDNGVFTIKCAVRRSEELRT